MSGRRNGLLGYSTALGRLYRIRLFSALVLASPGLFFCAWYAYQALATHHSYGAAVKAEEPLSAELFHLHLHDSISRDIRRVKMPDAGKSALTTLNLVLGNAQLDVLSSQLPPGEGADAYVRGYLEKGSDALPVRVRYRGRKHWHWLHPQKTWKVRLDDGLFFRGRAVFNLVNTVDPLPFSEQLVLDISRERGLLTPDYYPVRLQLNRALLGVYFLSTQPDEGLLRNARRIPGSLFSGSKAPMDPKTGVSALWKSASHWKKVATRDGEKGKDFTLLERLLDVVNNASQADFVAFARDHLDIEKFALMDALDVVFGSNSHDFHQDHKLYFDPYKARFEPIAWNFGGWRNPSVFNRTENPLLLRLKDLPAYRTLRNQLVHELISKDCSPESIRERARAIFSEISAEQAVDPFWDAYRLLPGISRYHRQMVRPMDQERQELVFESKMGTYERRVLFLRQELDRMGLSAAIENPTGAGGAIHLVLTVDGNAGYRIDALETLWPDGCRVQDEWEPVADTNLSGTWEPGTDLPVDSLSTRMLYPGNRLIDRVPHHSSRGNVRALPSPRSYRFFLPTARCFPTMLAVEAVNGATQTSVEIRIPFIGSPDDTTVGDGASRAPAHHPLAPAAANDTTVGDGARVRERERANDGQAQPDASGCADTFAALPGHESVHPWCGLGLLGLPAEPIVLGPGKVKVKETTVYPLGTTVVIRPGTTFRMSKKASLVFRGKVVAEGTAEAPIVFSAKSKKKRWGGIALVGAAAAGSRFSHVRVSGGTRPKWQLAYFPGTMNIHDTSDITVVNCSFEHNARADDALHVAYVTDIRVRGTTFRDCASDAIDLEFSTGELSGISVVGAGDDCVDLMGSTILVQGGRLVDCGGNAVSAGEETMVSVRETLVAGAQTGVLAKNASRVKLEESLILGSGTGARVLLRSARYGGKSRLEASPFCVFDTGTPLEAPDGGAEDLVKCGESLSGDLLSKLRGEVLGLASWHDVDRLLEELRDGGGR
jgi:hypothetical protein